MQQHISQLNEAQQLPVLQKDGPMMIIAGAGSGKTRVLTGRWFNPRQTHLCSGCRSKYVVFVCSSFTSVVLVVLKQVGRERTNTYDRLTTKYRKI